MTIQRETIRRFIITTTETSRSAIEAHRTRLAREMISRKQPKHPLKYSQNCQPISGKNILIFFNNSDQKTEIHTSTLPHKKKSQWRISPKKYNIYYVYNYISPQVSPKIANFWQSIFQVDFGGNRKSTHIFMWKCGSVENENRYFAPDSGEKYEGNLSKFAEGLTNFRGCYVLDIFSISSREIITTILVNFDVN